jgi:hypothetical protein
MKIVFNNDIAQASADLSIYLLDDVQESKATGRILQEQSDGSRFLHLRTLSIARDSSNNFHDKSSQKMESMSSITLGGSYTSFGASCASLCHSRWEPVTKAFASTNSPTKRFLLTIQASDYWRGSTRSIPSLPVMLDPASLTKLLSRRVLL